MAKYEYKVVPAPAKGVKVKGAKTVQARFAHALTEVMNELAGDGWEYLRADTLPCEERQGLTGKTTNFQNMLVFRREVSAASALAPEIAEVAAPEPQPQTPEEIAAAAAASLAAISADKPDEDATIAPPLSGTNTNRDGVAAE